MEIKGLFKEHGKVFSQQFLTLYFKERHKQFNMKEMIARHFIYKKGNEFRLHDIFSISPLVAIETFDSEYAAFKHMVKGYEDTHHGFVHCSHPSNEPKYRNMVVAQYCHENDTLARHSRESKVMLNTLFYSFSHGSDVDIDDALVKAIMLYFDDDLQGRKDDIKVDFA